MTDNPEVPDRFIMILADGSTFTSLAGCAIVRIPGGLELEQVIAILDADAGVTEHVFGTDHAMPVILETGEAEIVVDTETKSDITDHLTHQTEVEGCVACTIRPTVTDLTEMWKAILADLHP